MVVAESRVQLAQLTSDVELECGSVPSRVLLWVLTMKSKHR